MKVDSTGAGNAYTSQRADRAGNHAAATSFAAAMNTAGANSGWQVDFTHMTRQQLSDWMNDQIRSGNMTLDESTPFMLMTMKISVDTFESVDMATDTTPINFFQKARDGIESAKSRHDEAGLKMLESALRIMQQRQGQTIGVEVRA